MLNKLGLKIKEYWHKPTACDRLHASYHEERKALYAAVTELAEDVGKLRAQVRDLKFKIESGYYPN